MDFCKTKLVKFYKVITALIFIQLLSGCAFTADFLGEQYLLPNDNVRSAEYSVVTDHNIGFKTRDGIELVADVHRPKGQMKTPTILIRIPFTKTFSNTFRSDIIGRYWARRGYTVVIQGTRGRYQSEGTFYPLIHERKDGIETLKWLASQSWYNDQIVMWGGSAFGHTQWAIADQTAPGLDAFFIHIASTKFQNMFYPGNAFSLESAVYWAMRSRGEEDREVDMNKLIASIDTLPTIDIDNVALGDTDFFNDWVTKQNDAYYWNIIDGHNRAQTVQAPVLLLAGWFDPFLPTQIEDFIQIKTQAKTKVAKESRIIIGPWGHAVATELPNIGKVEPYRQASLAASLSWFDYQLERFDGDALDMPPVKIYVMGINQWRDENEWPLMRTQYTPFYLHSASHANQVVSNGRLDIESPQMNEQTDTYIYDPLDPVPSMGGAMLGPRSGTYPQNIIEDRSDVLIYSSEPMERSMEVTGPVRAILYVSTDAVSTDFTVKLIDVHPNGNAYNLSDGIIRKNYNQPLDKPVEIEIELWPTSNVFLKDHKIRVEISSSNFPRYDRNLNTGKSNETSIETIPANQIIFHSEKYPSRIILPIIP